MLSSEEISYRKYQKSIYSMHVTIENSDDPTLLYFSRRNGKKTVGYIQILYQ